MISVTRPSARTARGRRLALAVAVTLAATVWAAVQDDATPDAGAPRRPAHRGSTSERSAELGSAPAPDWPELPPMASRTPWRDPLPQGLAAWGPPAPPPAPAAPAPLPAAPEPPQPPEFPYALIGRLDDGVPRALLANRTRSFGAKAADVIDGIWRVDAVGPDGMTLTWLPGGISRTLAFPSS